MTGPAIRAFIARLRRDTSGSPGILLALAAPALIGIGGVAVDLGSLYTAQRKLQNIADDAAAAAVRGNIVNDGEAAAQQVVDYDGAGVTQIRTFTTGSYAADPTIAFDDRFVPGDPNVNAAKVTLQQDVKLHFASLLLGQQQSVVAAAATAARSDRVAFELGTRLASLGGAENIPDQLLSALAGTSLGLTQAQIDQLATSKVDIITFADKLRAMQGHLDWEYGQVFDATSGLVSLVTALSESADSSGAATTLASIAAQLQDNPVVMSQLIELGPYRRLDFDNGQSGFEVDAYSLLRSILEASNGNSYSIDLNVDVAGLAGATLKIVGGFGMERSPWLTLDSAGSVVLRTAETRLYLESHTASALGPLGKIRVPLYAELASATAHISDVDCAVSPDDSSVTIEATPSLGTLAIADVDMSQFDDLTIEPTLSKAQLVDTLLIDVDGYSDIALGGNDPQEVKFTMQEVKDQILKDVGTTDLVQATAQSLANGVDLDVSVGGLGLGLSQTQITQTVGGALALLAPGIDGLLDQVENATGIKLGVAELGVIGLQCGRPVLV